MDAIWGFLNNPILLFALGAVIKYVPGVRNVVSNWMIPFINTLVAWLAGLLGPVEAQAMAGPFAIQAVAFFGLGGFLGGLGAALWQSAQAFIIHAMFRHVMPAKPADSK